MPEITTGAGALLLTAALGYLLGSIPFGIVVTRAMGLGDLRRIGSGNIGATNVLRTGNRPAALATLLLDGGKGAAAVLAARALAGGADAAQLAGLAAFLGHLFPVWLSGRGGKGVATFLGTLLALAFPVGLAVCATWLATAAISRISSLSALVASATAFLWAALFGERELVILTVLLATLVFWRHRANIARLKDGTEPRIGAKP